MRIVTTPGANLDDGLMRAYHIDLAPLKVVVDGVSHDTHAGLELADIDRWVASAKEHPYVPSTSAAEFAELLTALTAQDREVLAITTSRKLIGSYAGAQAAVRELRLPSELSVDLHDTRTTDIGAGLQTLLAASAVRAGVDRATLLRGLELAAADAVSILAPDTLDNLVKGGRASYLRAWLANMLSVRPIIGIINGDLKIIDRHPRKEPLAPRLVELTVSSLGEGRTVWCAIVHGGVPELAAQLADEMKRRFDVRWAELRPFHASVYLHTGPRSLGLFVLPVDRLPWTPIAPS
jgi:DegV family protein with EDD domain